MHNKKQKVRSLYQPAFTIVELLIVIVIIAILAAITIIAFSGIQQRAAATVVKSDLASAARQLGLEHAENGVYPGDDGVTTDAASLNKSMNTTYQYTRTGATYCLTATSTHSGVPAFMISSDDTTPREGICPGHTGPSNGGNSNEIVTNSPIQDVTSAKCAALPVYTGSNDDAIRTVTDNRGGAERSYRIAKLADGKCWMLDNLKLGSTSGTVTLTASDSDVASNFILPQVTTSSSASSDSPRAYGPVPSDTGGGATNYGYLYNWSAATAGESQASMPIGSGDASHSICAKGWRLPSGGNTGDFALLNAKLNNPAVTSPSTASGSGFYQNWLYNGAFQGTLSGYRSGASFGHQGASGYYWSRTAFATHAGNAHHVFFNGSSVSPAHAGARNLGQAIRCVL